MCKKRNEVKIKIGNKTRKIDKCLVTTILDINEKCNFKTLSCCCGHNIFHPTIFIIKKGISIKWGEFGYIYELLSNQTFIPEKKRYYNFYILDKKTGLYFNPQIEASYKY